MSEKIVQLNEEVIKSDLKELVRGSVEETLNELLEKEAESLTQAARPPRAELDSAPCVRRRALGRPRTDQIGGTVRGLPRDGGTLPSSSAIAAGKAAWRKRSLRCILPVFPFAA